MTGLIDCEGSIQQIRKIYFSLYEEFDKYNLDNDGVIQSFRGSHNWFEISFDYSQCSFVERFDGIGLDQSFNLVLLGSSTEKRNILKQIKANKFCIMFLDGNGRWWFVGENSVRNNNYERTLNSSTNGNNISIFTKNYFQSREILSSFANSIIV